ncbi:serine/threonine-protein kinase pim-2-like [Genypterus blacodes]|uniref:serine/threonine-protein kinase pim-2-like n=1 Tax=Genypterus blacodes TaxID=154954 RepID=UPI003F76E2DC
MLSQHYIFISSGSQEMSRDAKTKGSPEDGQEGATKESKTKAFHSKYIQEECLGRGGFGAVFGGYCRENMKPVAIKHISQKNVDRIPVVLNGNMHFLPLEAVLMYFAMCGQDSLTRDTPTVALLDCFDLDDEVVLVMERPEPCMDLSQYIKVFGHMDENMAKNIHRQVVDAAIHMHLRQIFHRDIKPSNILLQLNSPDPCAKVIDFGCGAILTQTTYNTPTGTILSSPPEMLQDTCSYKAEPTTVWQLAVVLYTMLYGYRPFTDVFQIINNITPICNHVSRSCRDLLVNCLAKNPEDRPTLEEVRDHPWLLGFSPESSESTESTESTE